MRSYLSNKASTDSKWGSPPSELIVAICILLCAVLATMYLFSQFRKKEKTPPEKVLTSYQVAEAGKNHALDKLRSGSLIPSFGSAVSIFKKHSFQKGAYSVFYDANKTLDTLMIRSYGSINDQACAIEIKCARQWTGTPAQKIEAAVTTRSAVTTFGEIRIDGRDWDLYSDSVCAAGVYGVKSCGTFYQRGYSEIGGGGKAPRKHAGTGIVDYHASSVGYPTTPEEVLGVPPGALDKYKTITMPQLPFNGIVYYIPDGPFTCPDLKGSTGILICHNSKWSATIKNIRGSFNGILIADGVDKVDSGTLIYGAVVTLSEKENSNVFGSGNADIRYSSQIISHVLTSNAVVSWKQL